MSRLERWDVANPQKTLRDVVARARPVEGDVVVVTMAARTGGANQITDVTTVAGSTTEVDRLAASELLRRHAQAVVPVLPPVGARARSEQGGRRRGVDYVLVTVVFRNGRTLPGPTELFWAMAWRYSNHFTNAIDGDVYVVTPHGWTGGHDHRAGFTPALSSPLARALTFVL